MLYKSFLWLVFFSYSTLHATIINSDHAAYTYCLTHSNSYIVIVWPIAHNKDEEIVTILQHYGTLKYRKNFYLTYNQALYLLAKAHPYIHNIHEHVSWYFPPEAFEKPARIFVFKCGDHLTTMTCKYAIRHLFDLQYRSIHINDTHKETIELAKFFFINNHRK